MFDESGNSLGRLHAFGEHSILQQNLEWKNTTQTSKNKHQSYSLRDLRVMIIFYLNCILTRCIRHKCSYVRPFYNPSTIARRVSDKQGGPWGRTRDITHRRTHPTRSIVTTVILILILKKSSTNLRYSLAPWCYAE